MNSETKRTTAKKPSRFPAWGWFGVALIAAAWPLNWALDGLRTHLLFFPLWLGYCLVVDGVVLKRSGSSLIARSPVRYAVLFVVSAPAWWLFEAFNLRTENWIYRGREHFTDLQYFLAASLNFSTVIPAVFGTAELVSTFGWVRRLPPGPCIEPKRPVLAGLAVAGAAMLGLLLAWPRYFYPFVWGSVYCLLAPLNHVTGRRTLLGYTARRDWRPVVSLCLGGLICGFFWEMWNCRSYPKWVYRVPFVDRFHLFEMPLAGYIGYLPFSLELFALYHLMQGFARKGRGAAYVLPIENETG
jgi:hypothetical protein